MTTKTPILASCRRCGARVLEVRWDWRDDTLIGEPLLDPVSLDRHQVLACVLTDVALWQVQEHAGHPVTSRRTRWWPRRPIAGHTAPEHACGRVWDAFPISLAPNPTHIPDVCPY